MKITADTITDEQIVAMRDASPYGSDVYRACVAALHPLDAISDPARAHCAAVLNERELERIESRFPTAHAMLQLWAMPWSHKRLKYATWALHRARRAGCDVLENPRVMESMEMVAAGG